MPFKVEYSYEAVTLDYLSPKWYDLEGEYASQEEADAVVAAKREANRGQEPVAYRARYQRSQVEQDEFLAAEFAANQAYWADRARAEREAEAAEPKKGRDVEVVRGRKVPLGTKGYVIWYGEGNWGPRVGIKVEGQDEPVWTAASNVRVVQPEEQEEAA